VRIRISTKFSFHREEQIYLQKLEIARYLIDETNGSWSDTEDSGAAGSNLSSTSVQKARTRISQFSREERGMMNSYASWIERAQIPRDLAVA
jgi:hypothetical protein